MNIKPYFDAFNENHIRYVVKWLPEWYPESPKGSDIDIFCQSPFDIMKHVSEVCAKPNNIEKKVEAPWHHKYDIMLNGALIFRFDVYDQIHIDSASISRTIDRKIFETSVLRNGVWLPNSNYQMLFRLAEWINTGKQRPKKIKHLKWIKEQIEMSCVHKKHNRI